MKFTGLILAASLLLLSSCKSTRTLATWEKEGLTPKQYSKMVVYVNAPTLATRTTLERTIAKNFTKKKLEAVAASDKLPSLVLDSSTSMTAIQSAIGGIAADLLLHVNLGGTVEGVVATTSHASSSAGNAGTYNTMKTSINRISTTRMENRLYDVKAGDLMVSLDTESDATVNDDMEDVGDMLASELISQFKKKAIFFPKK